MKQMILLSLGLIWLTDTARGEDDKWFTFLQSDRLEYADESRALVWDLQGWLGDDYRKLWLKAEGERASGMTEESEIQLLYSRAMSPFFDWQSGIRYDTEPGVTHLVTGLQGLAPQWFEIDLAAFLSEDGDLSARIELEYDWLLTQRLVLQPRLEAELAASNIPELGVGRGLVSHELGLRLRYEVHRKFAPYIGLAWHRIHGRTADMRAGMDDDAADLTFLVGLRLWL